MPMFEHVRLANQLANREVFDEAVLEHNVPTVQVDLSTAHTSDLSVPATVAKAETSKHKKIWRGCRVGELNGLLQAHTFTTA